MKNKEEEYRDLFLTEALENFEELNRLFIELEQQKSNKQVINALFRITHTLKGNAMAMGYDEIAGLAHVMEDVMGAIKSGLIQVDQSLCDSLFRANDKLGGLIKAVETGEKVSYLGIKSKLAIFLKNAMDEQDVTELPVEDPETFKSEGVEEVDDEGDTRQEITFAEVVQIPVRKMDELINLVGELIIERDRLMNVIAQSNGRATELDSLKRISSNLQYAITNARLVQMGFLFNKFHRIVRDAAAVENKKVNLVLKGTEIETDRNILKIISDSLIHVVRNSVSHGIELPAKRKEMGKRGTGTVTLDARYEKDNVMILVTDDGGGIDTAKIRKKIVEKGMVTAEVAQRLSDDEVTRFIFEPGFSSAAQVTEISGRGVGMDVVKRAVESIGGQVIVESKLGEGSTIKLLLPSSLSLKGALLFDVMGQEYAIPLAYTETAAYLMKKDIRKIANGLMAPHHDKTITVVFLRDLLQMKSFAELSNGHSPLHKSFNELSGDEQLSVIVVAHSGRRFGIVVDKLIQQKEIIEKALQKPLNNNRLIGGTTILGSGNVCPVIDVAAITDLLTKSQTIKAV
jgi:two-component system, chemotaxis family, sensor kinase CheA